MMLIFMLAMCNILNAIHKEIDFQLQNAETTSYGKIVKFEYGTMEIDIDINDSWDKWEEVRNNNIRLEVKSVNVTNENDKTLTNLSNKIFNELEQFYTNY